MIQDRWPDWETEACGEEQALGTVGAFSSARVLGVLCLAAFKKREIEAEGGGGFVLSGGSVSPHPGLKKNKRDALSVL